jgi:hypothetical protein
MRMSDERRIAEGIASWLHFEFCCFRGKMLDESALKSSIGQILGALPATEGAMVYSNYAHPNLRRNFPRGRKPEVDYAVVSKHGPGSDPSVEYAIECKWADSSYTNGSRIVKDFLRLVTLRNLSSKSTECFFVLAGSTDNLKKILNSDIFRTESSKTKLIPKRRTVGKVKISDMPNTVKSGAGALFPAIQEFNLNCTGKVFNHNYAKESNFQVIAWRVI